MKKNDVLNFMDYELDSEFVKRMKSFFKDVVQSPLEIEIKLLDNEDYVKAFEENTTAILYNVPPAEKTKSKTYFEVSEHATDRIHVRVDSNKIDLSAVLHEFLHAHYPELAEEKLDYATTTFELAFRSYEKLLENKNLKNFFIKLCKENNAFLALANLPARV